MSPEVLDGYSKQHLIGLARREGIRGYGAMRKADLVRALSKPSAPRIRKASPAASTGRLNRGRGALSTKNSNEPRCKTPGTPADYLTLQHAAPGWTIACWSIGDENWERADAALGNDRFHAEIVLRVHSLADPDEDLGTQQLLMEIPVEREVNVWYFRMSQAPTGRVRAELGLKTSKGRFHQLVASKPGMLEEALPKDSPSPVASTSYAPEHGMGRGPKLTNQQIASLAAAEVARQQGNDPSTGVFPLNLNVELRIHGRTDARAVVNVCGKRVRVEPSGEFTAQFPLPNGRMVVPTSAVGPEGMWERTVVLAFESSLRELELRSLDEPY